ncbi:hypothetical protein AAIR98_000780 [Elusimicrobium simillimum]|uniref:hypothetical protein n=1 Tax=Elusimicrobium simillimum TaxID=3143438 RepID=UPI003C7039F4
MDIMVRGAEYGLVLGIIGFFIYTLVLLLKKRTPQVKNDIKQSLFTILIFIVVLVVLHIIF